MPLEAKEREGFVRAWGTVLARSWEDDDFKARLHERPADVLRESGLALKDGADVQLVTPPADAGPDLDLQISEYEKGAETGTYVFYVQDSNVVETQEVSEKELEGVAGGMCSSSVLCCCCC